MRYVIRGTTPTLTLTLSDYVDLSLARNVYVTIKQGNKTFELTGTQLDIDQNVISCYLTQEMSLQLAENTKTEVQVNWTYFDDETHTIKRAATVVREITIGKQLVRRVLQ